MVARIFSVSPLGFDGALIEVESDATRGLPGLQIVGLGNKAIDEAKERVRSAITNSFLEYPAKKITINLAPAELPKNGTQFDLPIALAVLIVSGQLKQTTVDGAVFAGELALDGTIRPVRGIINIAETARDAGFKTLYVPLLNAEQAMLITGIEVIGTTSIKELFLHLIGENRISPLEIVANNTPNDTPTSPLLDDIIGQEQAKRALLIAVAGRHNILLSGPPGAGKTMLAQTITSLLPSLTADERIATTKLHSLAGEIDSEILSSRPFRSPHHTTSRIAFTGGGTKPRPGEVSLAHLGILFLDELPEYAHATLESLRQPLEDKRISISRVNGRTTYPADFMLVATMNPCPCGYLGDTSKECTCTTSQILAYQKKLSGPLLDRIDLTMTVSRVPHEQLLRKKKTNSQHLSVLELINKAIQQQNKRYNSSNKYNGSLTSSEVRRLLVLSQEAERLLETAAKNLDLSARSYFKVIKVAQTIADLEQHEIIEQTHISEALQYRQRLS